MYTKVVELLRGMANDFCLLANEFEEAQKEINGKMCALERETETNRQALKDAAHAILSKFD